jgi:hypothetical protein
MTPRRFAVYHSARAWELLTAALQAASAVGRGAEARTAARAIERGLLWYADGFGESRQQLRLLGELRWACVLPLSVWFAVDVVRWEVQVSRYRFVPHRPRSSP